MDAVVEPGGTVDAGGRVVLDAGLVVVDEAGAVVGGEVEVVGATVVAGVQFSACCTVKSNWWT